MACMTRPFVKMNGAGNDFIVIDALETPFRPTEDQIRALADRAKGEGFDQLIAIEPSDTADAFMRVWNADGSRVETCGNALRCVGWLLMQAKGSDRVVIDTAPTGHTLRLLAAPDFLEGLLARLAAHDVGLRQNHHRQHAAATHQRQVALQPLEIEVEVQSHHQ